MSERPLRIVLVSIVRTSRGEKLKVLCDNNVWYLFPELAKAIKVSPEALRARFARMHWSNPEILAQNRFKAHRGGKSKAKPRQSIRLSSMGDRPRAAKLATMAVGVLERRL